MTAVVMCMHIMFSEIIQSFAYPVTTDTSCPAYSDCSISLLLAAKPALTKARQTVMQNAFVFSGDDIKDIEINFGMHKNVIEGLEAAGCNLQHVYFNAGGKWYGE